MKKVLISLAFALTFNTLAAQNSTANTTPVVDELVCTLNSGIIVKWQLSEQPKVELIDGEFAVNTSHTTVFYSAKDVNRFTLEKNATAIRPISMADAKIQKTSSGRLLISGCQAGEKITVYATDGKKVLDSQTDKDGMLTFSIDALPVGVYIVKSKSVNLKVVKQ